MVYVQTTLVIPNHLLKAKLFILQVTPVISVLSQFFFWVTIGTFFIIQVQYLFTKKFIFHHQVCSQMVLFLVTLWGILLYTLLALTSTLLCVLLDTLKFIQYNLKVYQVQNIQYHKDTLQGYPKLFQYFLSTLLN